MPTRRKILLDSVAITATASVAAAVFGLSSRGLHEALDDHLPESEPPVLRPPGALADERDFLASCIRCTRCQDACPVGAIQLAGNAGPTQPGTPFLLPAEQACTMCLKCTTACPSGALMPLTDRTRIDMGTAVVDKRTCVSHNRTGACGSCHTACPLRNKALTQGLYNAPEVHPEFCTGCGLCEQACILKGVKAIRVFSTRRET